MAISFKKLNSTTQILNPQKNFAPEEIPFEIRFDPLTGQTGRVFDLPFTPPATPDLQEIVARSKEIPCPFCPDVIEKITPHYPTALVPEGRIRVGDAILFPNILPLDRYTGISVLSKTHYVPMEDFTPENMQDAFRAALIFINRVAAYDPGIQYFNINWNYMPQAGSSLVHPHIQVNCGDTPTNQFRVQLDASRGYYEKHNALFWEDFVQAEKAAGERFVGERGSTAWFLSFVPQTIVPDLWCIFTEHDSLIDLKDQDLLDFLEGLSRALAYIDGEGFFSFNVALFFVREESHFRANARVCPRTLLREIGNSDHTYYQALHKEPCTHCPPETICEKVRGIFSV